MKTLPPAQLEELPKLEQSTLLELFTIDCTAFDGEIYHICNQVNEKRQPVVFNGISYTPYPLEAKGFAVNAQGASTRPTLSVSNLFGLVTALVEENKIIGACVTRKQVYAKHLDAVNFIAGNDNADPNAVTVSLFVVEAVKSLNKNIGVFTLALPCESDNLKIPRRIIISNTSPSAYKSSTGVLAYREE